MAYTAAASSSNRNASPQYSTEPDLVALYARKRDPELRQQIIDRYRGLVEVLAAKFSRPGAAAEDVVQVGMIGLIQALDRFDPNRGVKFTTYAVNTIVGEIKHYFRDCTWMVKVPRQLQEIASKVRRAVDQLSQQGHPPTIAQLATHLGISEEIILEAMDLEAAHTPYSLDAQMGNEESEQQDRFAEVLGRRDLQMDALVDNAPLWSAIDELEPRKRWILQRRYVDEWSQTEVGKKLGISQMHVSRLEREALAELRQVLALD